MATTLAPVDSREVVRCYRLTCQLTQFRTSDNNCRRCHASLEPPPEPEPAPLPPPLMLPLRRLGGRNGRLDDGGKLASAIRSIRLRNWLSQRELAGRMKLSRTWVSKAECGKVSPVLKSMAKLARALNCVIPDLLIYCERERQEEIETLLKDCFIRRFLPFVAQLSPLAMAGILSRVADLVEERRRADRARIG